MSIHINSDKEKFQGSKPKLVGDNELTVRGGTGSLEKEILRTQLDANTGLPRVGINRTGQRVNDVKILTGGSGYISPPTITLSAPIGGSGVQAQGSAFIFNGQVVSIAVNDPGSGYTQAPTVTIQGGGGVGASAEALLDTVDFELDINGAIRTSTSIISDTARILNLDIDNFVTPNAAFRAPSLKTYINNSGTLWSSNIILQENAYRYFGQNVYQALNSGQTGSSAPVHTDGEALNGEVNFKHIGFRVVDENDFGYSETGASGVFPRSITPLLGDRSDKIATTEYVLNLATNDVGGRIYVSQTIGSDLNDGRSAVNPVRSIKKAAQLAWATPGVKETLIVSGGDYVEDNPISLPPDASVVGDNLRLVIIRPANPGKHIFKFGDKNYVTGVTYRDKIDSNGDAVATWDFAMVFDDKQRILIDADVNGDFGTSFPIGHQIFGPQQFRVTFQNNTGLSTLITGLSVIGVNTGSRANIQKVVFDDITGPSAYISGTLDITLDSGSFVEGEQFNFVTSISYSVGSPLALTSTGTTSANKITFSTDPTSITPAGTYVYLSDDGNAIFTPSAGYYEVTQIEPNDINNPTSWEVSYLPVLGSTGWTAIQTASIEVFTGNAQVETLNTTALKSIRAEGEVVSVDDDYTSLLPISRLDFSLQGDTSIATGGFQGTQFGNAEDLGGIVFYTNALVGRNNTHEFKEGQEILIEGLPTSSPDLSALNGRQRIYKVLEDADGRCRRFVIPKKMPSLTDAEFDPGQFATVKTATKSITLSLLNSPNTFPISSPVDRRFQDACTLLRNNRDFIADEVVGKINDQFARYFYSAYNISGNSFDIFVGLAEQSHTYVSGGTVKFGGTTYNVLNFVYSNAVTGVATVTTDSLVAGLNEDDHIKLEGMTLECDAGQKVYPSYSSPSATGSDGDSQCKEDIVHFINAIIRDLEFGSNHNVIEAAQKYIVDGKITYIEDEIIQNARAIEYARELAIYCMRNWRTENGAPSDPIYTPVYSSIPRYFDDTIITLTAGTPACANVASAIDTLSFLWSDVITNNASGTYLDAAYLISRNKDLIADQALIDTETQFPSLNLSDTNQRKCRRDIRIVLDGLIKDLVLGGNNGIVTVAESYFTGVQLTGIAEAQRPSTIYAFQRVKIYALETMRNWSDGVVDSVTPVGAIYNSTTGDLNITYPVSGGGIPQVGDRIAFTEDAITFSCDMGGGAANHASPNRFDSNYGKSYEINSVTGTTMIAIGLNVGDAGTAAGIAHTFVSAKTNGTIIIFNPTTVTSTIPRFDDWNILLDSTPLCANVATSINTIMDLFEDILDETISAGTTVKTFGTLFDPALLITYPDNFIYDSNNVRMAIRGDFDDNPIIEASPYTQNASVISFLGGGGALIDGSKVKQPNCPFPGLELDGTASFPNQGKSMVAAAFTIVSFGGTGYKVINDGYTQLVSVFVIFCADGVLCESGGYASITNSATNFGQYALRGIGFREDPYTFDIATISNVSSTPTGRTILTVTGLGREPLEHYVAKIDGYRNTNTDIEYFVDVVAAVTVGPPFSAQLTFDDGTGGAMDLTDNATNQAVSTGSLLGKTINLHRPSIVNSSSHTWEFAGSGTNYLALPENGGTKIEAFEQVSEQYGRVYVSGTDELGDFKVGTFARIENRTGNITFTGTVTISEVEFLKLKGGDVVVTGFDASNTLGGATATDSKLPTQKAVRDYITNNLGPYINKPYSTNAVPRALVELTDSGKISIDQIPALRPFSVFTVANQAERTSLEGALAGDIAIQQDTSTSFILNNDNSSLFLGFAVDPALSFTIGDVFTGSISTGRIQSTEYRKGVVYQINVTNGGSGYVTPPVITFAGGNPEAGAVAAAATCTIANGTVVTVTIIDFNGYKGGFGYTTAPTITFAAPPGAGVQAQGNALLESRLYGNIVNNIKIEDTDTINDSTSPTPNTININRGVNTSSFDINNWVSLSSNQIAASDITSGVIETDRLASGGAANSFTFLRGDQNFALAMQSIKGAERRYFALLAAQCNSGSSQMLFTTNSDVLIGHEVKNNVAGVQNNTNITGVITAAGLTTVALNNPVTQNIPINTIIEFERGESPMTFESTYTLGGFVDAVIVANGGSGYTNGQYFDVELQGGTGTGLKANIVVSGNAVTDLTVTDGGSGYNADYAITVSPTEIGAGSNLVLNAKVSTVNRQYANVAIDITRVSDLTISADLYGTIGVSRYKKAQFNIGQAGNGSVELKTGPDSGLDADLLDGQQGNYYTNASNLFSGTIPSDRLNGTYNIDVSGSSNNTIRLQTGTNNPTSNPDPNSFVEGAISNTVFNSSNGLGSAYPSVNTGIGSGTSTKHLVLTLRNGASGFDASFGGVRQLAFANDDNMYLRGSGNGVTTWNSWARVWSSLNDGVDSGLDADRLDNRQGTWYQDALNINYGTLSENRLPRFISETKFRDKITIKSFSGDPKYRIYVSGQILNTAPFIPGDPTNPSINLYNANAQGVGSFVLDNVITNDDLTDNFNDYTILIGRLTSGNFVGALTIGTASNRVEFDDFTIEDGNTVEVANFQSNGGVAELQLGRKDGNTSSPSIIFNSSQLSANFNAKIEASGGNATDGSGALNVSVVNANAFTINNQVIWNAGNILFSSSNVPNYAVQRDASGNFSAGTITADVTGASSLNVLKTGDTMTGPLVLTGSGSNLTVSGTTNLNSFVNVADDFNVDSGVLFVDVSANEVGVNTTNPVANLDVVGDLGIFVRTSTDSVGAQIRFSDLGSAAQNGKIEYYHSDSNTPNSQYNEAFFIEGTETKLALQVTGDILATRRMGVGLTREPNFTFEVAGNGCFNDGLTIDQANDNSGAPISFRGASSYRNFRVGNQLVGNHLFTIQASTNNGGTTWNGTPAISIKGDVNAVSINTTSTSGVDPESNTTRNYKLNVQGDMNINGQFFQNNAEFVTSRWTEATNNLDIYRISKVGVNKADPVYELDVSGDIQVANGTLYSNGVKQWIDSYGIFKSNSNTVAEDVTIPANINCVSAGPITIATGYTVTINSGGNWAIV
jgi:hypothetical protein